MLLAVDTLDFGEDEPKAGQSSQPGLGQTSLDVSSTVVADSPLLRSLNPEQVAAVTTDANRLCIIAGAGSGKTRVLTHRIAYRSQIEAIDPRRVLALTFTRKAASELTRRLRQLGLRDDVSAGTFHGVAYAQLRARAAETGRREPQLLERKVGFVAKLISRGDERTQAFDVVTEIEWAKARLISPQKYVDAIRAAGRQPNVDPQHVANLFADYEEKKQRMGLVDFDDLLGLTASELRRDRRWGEAQRWRFRHLFVDEFQDVNPLQFALLKSWLSSEADLCVVGDPRQAIYAWNGADSGYITKFGEHFANSQTLTLRRNHRSSPQILAAAEAVLDPSMSDLEPLIATRNPGPTPTITAYATDLEEAAGVARAVRDARRPGDTWSNQAILTRTNGQLARFEVALRASSIPFRTRAGSDFLERPEVKKLFEGLAQAPSLRIAITDLELELEVADDAYSGQDDIGPGSDVGSGTAGPVDADDLDRHTTIGILVEMAREFLVLDPDGPGSRFAGWLHTAVGSDRSGSITDAVELSTFHAAKGLEWPVVHVAGLEAGYVPLAFAKTHEALLEERNLLHVAVTRAERVLSCSWAQRRTFKSSASDREPSPYLDELARAAVVSASDTIDLRESAQGPQEQLANLRARRAAAAGDEANQSASSVASLSDRRREAVEQWREKRAAGSSVTPAAILSDEHIDALVAAMPTSVEDLIEAGLPPVKANRFGESILQALTLATPARTR